MLFAMATNKAHIVVLQFNDTINRWLGFLNGYTLEALCMQPAPRSWSLGQVYIHIINNTRYYIEQMRISLSGGDNSEKEMHERAMEMFANNSFPNMLIEGPDTHVAIRQPLSKDELLKDMKAIRDEVNQLYSTYDLSASKGKTRHPGLLFFSAVEWLQFAEMHMRHHKRQKKRIDEKLAIHHPHLLPGHQL